MEFVEVSLPYSARANWSRKFCAVKKLAVWANFDRSVRELASKYYTCGASK
jgi:hypothetical protein